ARELGDSAAALCEIAPDLELLIGPQPPAPPLGAADARGRLHALVARLLAAIASRERPLLVFLDDLQWADDASLELLRHLVAGAPTPALVVLAYRSRHVGPDHPLALLIDAIAAQVPTLRLPLAPLPEPAIRSLLAERLGYAGPLETSAHLASGDIDRLAALLHGKTLGNPFEVMQLVDTLVGRGDIAFDDAAGAWRFELARIAAGGLTDSVADLLAGRLRREPPTTQALIQLAACIGKDINVAQLARLMARSPGDIRDHLQALARDGFVVAEGQGFRFGHDRIRDAAYRLGSAEVRAGAHLAIARDLQASTRAEELHLRGFEIADHLRLGAERMRDDERERAAAACLAAASSAQATGSFRSGASYCASGLLLLPEAAHDGELAFELRFLEARCRWPVGEFESASAILFDLLPRASRRLARLRIYRELVALSGASLDLAAGQAAVSECLVLFGRTLPLEPSHAEVLARHALVQERLGARAIEDLVDLPFTRDPESEAVLDVLRAFAPLAWGLGRALRDLVACEMMELTLAYGLSAAAAEAAVYYAAFVTETLAEPALGGRFASLARALLAKKELRGSMARVHNVCAVFEIWTRPFAHLRHLSELGYRAACDVGDQVFASFNAAQLAYARLSEAHPLTELLLEAQRGLAVAEEAHFNLAVDNQTGIVRLVAALRGDSASVASLSAPGFDEARFAARLESLPLPHFSYCYRDVAIVARYLGGDFRDAWALATRNAELRAQGRWVLTGLPLGELLGVLAGAALCDEASADARPALEAALAEADQRWERLGAQTPENFRAMHLLVRAEHCRVRGDRCAALATCDEAIRAARDGGMSHLEGVGCELAARLLRSGGVALAARSYLRKARRAFARWGADGKVALLEAQFPELADLSALARSPRLPAAALDMLTLAKASQAIGSELAIERLAPLLVRITVESSGARKGHLVLDAPGGLAIVDGADPTEGGALRTAPLDADGMLPASIVRYAHRTRHAVLLDDAASDHRFVGDPYIRAHRPRSILCVPIVRGTRAAGVIYLENNLMAGAFTSERATLVAHLAAQAAIALDNARLVADLRRSEQESARLTADLRRLASSIIAAEDTERRQLARDLHDSIGQLLPALKLELETQAARPDEAVVGAVAERLGDIHRQIRTLTFELYPTMLDDLGLVATLEHYGRKLADEGLTVSVEETGPRQRLTHERAIFLFRAVRELLRNVVKHAAASEAMVSLSWWPTALRVVVADDGAGFDGSAPWHRRGFGLFDIRERLTQLGGQLRIESAPGTSTAVILDLPLVAAELDGLA
ncbi:MAG: AAA family ATPase, partial [Myxococcota bacterium]